VKKLSEGRERLRQEAGLDDFKLPRIQDNQAPTKALVIACSESAVLSAFVASLDPLSILQNLGGTLPSSQFLDDLKHKDDDTGWGTVAYALCKMGVRQVVLCGHSECGVATATQINNLESSPVRESGIRNDIRLAEQLVVAAELPAAKRTSQLWLLEQLLRMNAYLAHPAFHLETDVRVYALWFDEDQRQLSAYSRDQRRFVVMDQPDIERLFAALRAGGEGRAMR
jgi:carbonic anhydrase